MNAHRLMQVIMAPVISEKSARGAMSNQYAFRVLRDSTKPEIKAAVEKMFEVKVVSVTISNVRGKIKRFGLSTGKRPGWKKATVRLQDGHEIDVMGSE